MKKLISIIMMLIICVSAFASCGGEDVSLQEAGTYLYNLYKDDAELTPSDYDVAGLIKIGELTYNVEWSVDVKEGVTIKESETNGFFTIDVDEKTEKEIAYVLTATIKNEDGDAVTKSFNRKIPAYKVFSYAEYAAAADDSTVVVKGIITGIISKSNGSSANGLYLQDTANEGGYYIYGIKDGKDPMTDLGLKLGMTVEATGLKDTYNGLYEIIDASIEVLDKTENKVTPVDYTEILKNAEKLSDEALVGKQSILVTIKGVEITGQVTASGYYNFKLGDLETYVRISSSNNCISKDEQTAFIKTHTDNFGYVADVTGIVQLYSGNFYLIPATAETFTNMALPERSDSEKLEMELGNITITDKVTEDTVVELPLTGATYPEVKFEWTSDNACAVIDADGKLTITLPEEDATVTITLKVTVGEVTETKTFEIKVDGAATDLYIPNKAETLEAGKAYKLAMWQAQLGKYLYFNGEMSGYYFGITDKANKAVDVYVEAVDGGYRFYILGENDAKMYLEIYKNGNYVNTKLSAEPSAVFVYDEEAKTYVVDIEGTKYYLGTYGTKEDLRCSATSYITGDNANKVGDSQHVAFFATIEFVK